jgi:uncharacterized protein YndB with AHSA1/START domain
MSEHEQGRGTAVVSVRVDRPVEAAWSALTEPAGLGKWFGAADTPLRPGEVTKVDFGDGDYFVIHTDRLVPRNLVEFRWRFLGTGPESVVRWEIRRTGTGCEVTVIDHEPRRDDEGVRELVEGWCDFLGRLRVHLTTGAESRYDWRGDIDGSVDVPSDRDLLAPRSVQRWLPIATDGFGPRWFFIVDDEGPRRFEIADWHNDGEQELTFQVLVPGSGGHTDCAVRVRQAGDVQRLGFSHTGWRELGLPDDRARGLRARFAATWATTMGNLDKETERAR